MLSSTWGIEATSRQDATTFRAKGHDPSHAQLDWTNINRESGVFLTNIMPFNACLVASVTFAIMFLGDMFVWLNPLSPCRTTYVFYAPTKKHY